MEVEGSACKLGCVFDCRESFDNSRMSWLSLRGASQLTDGPEGNLDPKSWLWLWGGLAWLGRGGGGPHHVELS